MNMSDPLDDKEGVYCKECGNLYFKEKISDGLDEIFDKHRNQYKSGKEWQKEISKDLRNWKKKAVSKNMAKWFWDSNFTPPTESLKEEKPKKLWEIVMQNYVGRKTALDSYQDVAKATLDWFEKNVLESLEKSNSLGWNACLREIKQRLVEEKEAF